ncbi:MAG: hypothetical protein AABX59_03615, partial [Nanoarchaeota archaeon]
MSYRLIIAAIAFILVIVLVILGGSGIGLKVEEDTIDSVKYEDIFSNQTQDLRKSVVLQTIKIENNFFMPQAYELPQLIVCADGSELYYYTYQGKSISPGVYDPSVFPFFEPPYSNSEFVNLGPYKSENIVVVLQPSYYEVPRSIKPLPGGFFYDGEVKVNELIIYKVEDRNIVRYPPCQNA